MLHPNIAGAYEANKVNAMAQDGIEVLEKALSINPNLIDASNWLQIAYGETGDNRRALAILEDMVERDPLYPPGFANAIITYNLFGLQDKSWALLDRIRPFLQNDPQVLQSEAATWMSLGRPAKALPLIESALETQPSDFVIRNFLGFGLLQTAQFERAIEEGQRWHKAFALSMLNRQEEAMMIATELAGEGIVRPTLGHLDRNGQHQELIEFVESRYTDLEAFESENPDGGGGDGGGGYSSMLRIAHAYSVTRNEARFNDAMARVRAAHDRSIDQGATEFGFLADEARYYVLSGNREQALALLDQAVDGGMVSALPFVRFWPEMEIFTGDPAYEAIQTKMFDHMNAERTELGLEPLST